MKWALTLIALALLAVIAVSRRLSGTPVTPQMVFLALGVLVGPEALDGVQLSPTGGPVRTLAESTLALVLFADASRINLRALRTEYSVPVRLLGIGLPLTIVLGAVVAAVLFGELTPPEAAILAILLAPTDAALGQAVVSDERLPMRVRQGLNVESGLNDGICVPLLFIAIGAADVESSLASGHGALTVAAEEIGYGVLAGVAAGLLTAGTVIVAERRKLMAPQWQQLAPVAGAALAYGLATALGGSGFIAAFLAGIGFGWLMRGDTAAINRFNEELGDILNGVTFIVFGALLLGPTLAHLTWQIGLYALCSLTVVRMLPVAIAMIGTHARAPTVAFMGWFGPRGLASIVFALIVVQESHLPHTTTIVLTAYATVGLSTFAHGISASPLVDRYARWLAMHPRPRLSDAETGAAPSLRTRGSTRALPST
jgi:NhaP-type Na+/H+ or K+/H+ antiporter